MARGDREKASDIFNKSSLVFAEKVTFAKAFPTIEQVAITYQQTGYMLREWQRGACTVGGEVGEFIDCGYSLCSGGGFSIGSVIREMVRNNETTKEFSAMCKGYEGSPKGRRKYRSCMNHFKGTVTIAYKPASPANGEG